MNHKTGCLLIHGFGGNVAEVAPLAEYLKEKGYEVLCPSLKGHTGKRRDLAGVSYKEWIHSAEEGFLQLTQRCERVVIIGFSMGGLIGVNLVKKYGAAALITLNSPIYHWDFRRIAINVVEDLRQRKFDHLRRYLSSCLKLPLSALINFKLILKRTKAILKDIESPVFVAQALEDDTVQYRSAQYIYEHVSSSVKEIRHYTKSGHLICHSEVREELFMDIGEFVSAITGNSKYCS